MVWTFVERFEFKVNTRHILPGHKSRGRWTDITCAHMADSTIKINVPANVDHDELRQFTKDFFKFACSEDQEAYTSLKEFLYLQNYLKTNNIPYLFTAAQNSYYKNEHYDRISQDSSIANVHNSIDWDKWFFFPAGTQPKHTLTPRGFHQWARENGYSAGPDLHPLEEAHRDAAALLQEKFDELVN